MNCGAGCACGCWAAFAGGGTATALRLLLMGALAGGVLFFFFARGFCVRSFAFLFVFVVGCMDDDDPGESAEDLLLALPVVSEDFGLKLIRCSGTEQVESSSVKCTSMFHFLSEGTQQDTTVASKMPKPGQLTWTSWSGFRRFSLLTRDMILNICEGFRVRSCSVLNKRDLPPFKNSCLIKL